MASPGYGANAQVVEFRHGEFSSLRSRRDYPTRGGLHENGFAQRER